MDSDSKENPWWCTEHDQPKAILTPHDWQEAQRAGFITAEHVILRLSNMLERELGEDQYQQYDEDGFVTALIAAGLPLENGITLQVFPRDHPPPHVHVLLRSHPGEKITLSLETGEFLETPRQVSSKALKRIQSLVRLHQAQLAQWWQDYQGELARAHFD